MKKHAFIISCHKQPNLLLRILKVLEDENHYFFVHVDGKSNIKLYPPPSEVNNLCYVKHRISVYHSCVSQIHANISLLKCVKEFEISNNVRFDFVHHISGQDYPLRSNKVFDNFFDNTDKSFMYINTSDYYKVNGRQHLEDSVYAYQTNNKNIWWSRIWNRIAIIISHHYPRKNISNLWGATDWYSWNRKTYTYVLSFVERNPEFVKRFNFTSASLEIFIGTLLHGKEKELNIDSSNLLRYVSWIPRHELSSKHLPYDLDERDYDYVINSKSFFCRKVDEIVSSKLLDKIDSNRDSYYNVNNHDYNI